MFVDSVRGWAGRPAVAGAGRPRPSWVSRLIDRASRRVPLAAPDVAAAQGASDVELVRFVRDRRSDAAEKNRHEATMLFYAASGRV